MPCLSEFHNYDYTEITTNSCEKKQQTIPVTFTTQSNRPQHVRINNEGISLDNFMTSSQSLRPLD